MVWWLQTNTNNDRGMLRSTSIAMTQLALHMVHLIATALARYCYAFVLAIEERRSDLSASNGEWMQRYGEEAGRW